MALHVHIICILADFHIEGKVEVLLQTSQTLTEPVRAREKQMSNFNVNKIMGELSCVHSAKTAIMFGTSCLSMNRVVFYGKWVPVCCA